ncbi:hypothetical protein [Paenibacillus thiaminolyticus]|uniref:hypothetical protein n=1 Tax=Paenibacillus thiaminolyticus TaxID=49283 RepID=UPI001F10C6A0|nr:hypothetical protein [Paenibacillus thiaminolyticus]
MKKQVVSTLLVSILLFLMIPLPLSFAYPDGLLNGKEMDTINSSGTKVGVTSNITDGDFSSSLVLQTKNSNLNGVSYTFEETKTITAYQLKSEKTVNDLTNRLVIEFKDESNRNIKALSIPSFSGYKTYLETPITGVKKVVIRNDTTSGSTTIYEFDVFDDPQPEPTYLGGLLDGKPLTISNDYGAILGTTMNVTDGDTNTLFSIENRSTSTTVNQTRQTQLYYEFTEPTLITAFQLKADKTQHPMFNVAALAIEFIDSNNETVSSISLPTYSGLKVYLESPISDVKKVVLKTITYEAKTPVREFNVFGPEIPTEPENPEKPEPNPEPEQPKGERAILVVTMTTGLEKEFDLSMDEVNAFIAWYENKQAGTGTASYAIDKHNNNKGPFSSRKDYVIYDKILTFEVNEYTVN